VRILLVDDHIMMRDGLRVLLEQEGLEIVGEAANGHEAIALAERLKPHIVVMDITMPELNGIDATRRIVTDLPGTKVIALSVNADRRYVIAMFQAGAAGYLLKNSASEELIQAVRAVSQNLTYVSPSIGAIMVDNLSAPGPERAANRQLSPREREVLQLLAEGKTSKDIAHCLNLSVPTIETHRRQIMHKLNLRTIAELTKYAIREGLTSVN
jgi:DNA-binding NarL/FixJ family response regulator